MNLAAFMAAAGTTVSQGQLVVKDSILYCQECEKSLMLVAKGLLNPMNSNGEYVCDCAWGCCNHARIKPAHTAHLSVRPVEDGDQPFLRASMGKAWYVIMHALPDISLDQWELNCRDYLDALDAKVRLDYLVNAGPVEPDKEVDTYA